MISRPRLAIGAASFLFFGCTQSTTYTSLTNTSELYAPGPDEEAYCQPNANAKGVTIRGQALFQARQVYDHGGGVGGLGPAPGETFPIRQAEVRAVEISQGVVQCAQTDDSGNFTLTVPKDITLSIEVLSRAPAASNRVQASILNRPAENKLYKLSTSIFASQDQDIGTLTATATGDVLGGAFNIFDQILRANDFIRSKAGSCSRFFPGCEDFTVAPKVYIYWMKGVDPGKYFGSGGSPLSFYLPGYARLFILGGVGGDVDYQDTDHFDNSVIIHEYGHFLEDNMFATSSPGGPHSGDGIVDPRLAWSEGWGNFFQAAVRNDPKYIDTYGNVDGMTGFSYHAELETPVPGNDFPTAIGEGNFREFSVTRFLWDLIDDTPNETRFGGQDNMNDRFVEIWSILSKQIRGFRDPNVAFLNIGWFHWMQDDFRSRGSTNTSDQSQVRLIERHVGDTRDYAQLVQIGSCPDFQLAPMNVAGDTGSMSTSDLFRNNKFYYLNLKETFTGTLSLVYQDAGGASGEADADLYLYNQSARFGDPDDWVGKSTNVPDGNPQTPESENIDLRGLGPGKYLINVHVETGGASPGNPFQYRLLLNGATLCPATL